MDERVNELVTDASGNSIGCVATFGGVMFAIMPDGAWKQCASKEEAIDWVKRHAEPQAPRGYVVPPKFTAYQWWQIAVVLGGVFLLWVGSGAIFYALTQLWPFG